MALKSQTNVVTGAPNYAGNERRNTKHLGGSSYKPHGAAERPPPQSSLAYTNRSDSPQQQADKASTPQAGIALKPFVNWTGPQQIEATAGAQVNDLELLPADSVLSGHIRQSWQRNKLFKERIQLELLRDLRARRGQYSASQIQQMQANGTRNFLWVDITETKCRAGSAWIREVMLPVGDKAWQLAPSPLPELPIEFKQHIHDEAAKKARSIMQQQYQAGANVMPLDEFRKLSWEIATEMQEEIVDNANKAAGKAAELMEKEIREHMLNGGFDEAVDEFVEDFVTHKAAFLAGPLWQQKKELFWLPGFKVGVRRRPTMCFERIDPFDAFPAPYGQDCQVGDVVVRRRYRRDQLYDLIGIQGYREDAIRDALRAYSNGHLEAWLWTEAERQRLQQETMYTFLSPWGIIDALWYWGSVPGWKLMSWGLIDDNMDPERDYEVEAQVVGPYVIMCRLNPDPLGRRPIWCASYDSIPGALWGRSVPELCETSQSVCNAAASALADNLGMTAGVMLWVHNDRLAEGEDPTDIYPWRVFQLKSAPDQGVNPGVGVLNVPSLAEQLQALVEKWDVRADDATGIPRYTYGNEQVGGAADTYAGLSMLMNNAAKGLRRAIASIDMGVYKPCIQMTYEYEMIWGTNLGAKGDCKVEARGAAAVLVKAAVLAAYQNILQISLNPIDQAIFGNTGRAEVWRHVLKGQNIPTDNIIPTDEQIQQTQQSLQQQQQDAQQAQQQAQVQQLLAQGQQKAQLEQIQTDSKERIAGAKIVSDHVKSMRDTERDMQGNDQPEGGAARPPPKKSQPKGGSQQAGVRV